MWKSLAIRFGFGLAGRMLIAAIGRLIRPGSSKDASQDEFNTILRIAQSHVALLATKDMSSAAKRKAAVKNVRIALESLGSPDVQTGMVNLAVELAYNSIASQVGKLAKQGG